MEQHGKTLAQAHVISKVRHPEQLLARLAENEEVLLEGRRMSLAAIREERRITPAGEWLLDNFYLIEEQIRTARRHFPKGYNRELPRLSSGPSAGLPRVYDIALETISHGDGQLDPESLRRFLVSYQTVTTLRLGELWAIPIMLRLALIENLRRVAERIANDAESRTKAEDWADKMVNAAEHDPNGLLLLTADMARSSPPMVSAFVAELSRRLRGRSAALAMPLTWLEQLLSRDGLTINQLVQAENQQQAADQVSISNSIGSLRLLSAINWRDFVEEHSVVEQIFRTNAGGVYGRMDFATRDSYRHAAERLAKASPLAEEEIARLAVHLASQQKSASRHGHIGYYLIDKGLPELERAAGVRKSTLTVLHGWSSRHPLSLYLGSIALLTAILAVVLVSTLSVAKLPDWLLALTWLLVIFCAGQSSVTCVNWLATLVARPNPLPKMDFSAGIPPESRALVVVPTMLTSAQGLERLIEGLQVRYLANRDRNLHFGIVTDFADSAEELNPADEALLLLARQSIEALNDQYRGPAGGPFYLFHRARAWNSRDRIWMGYERKRGKLGALNAYLRNPRPELFSLVVGETQALQGVKYVITLDTDTQLPRDAARQCVGAMAHPLNRPQVDERSQLVTEGYGILQPRVAPSLPGINRSLYARMCGGEAGIDPYTRAVSDVYQDVFGEGSFIGKGIYDVDAFEQVIKGRFPENRILSHDLLEGCYARAGLLSDVQVYEADPISYSADIGRRHRWIRGDWQIARWLWRRVPQAEGSQRNPLSALSRWKIFDNLRRSLMPAATVILLLLSWAMLARPWLWTLAVIAVTFGPSLLASLLEPFQKPPDILWSQYLPAAARSTRRRFAQAVFQLICLPYEAKISADAILRTLWRMAVARRKLLEWSPSSEHTGGDSTFAASLKSMWIGPAAAAASVVYLAATRPMALMPAVPVLALWFASPAAAWWMSRPLAAKREKLTAEQTLFLRRMARKTWGFFETFVGPGDHWLPPDNYQESPTAIVAHRTSPTNMGLALLANLAAYDLGYIALEQFLERTSRALETMAGLERFRGHFYNWYDTQTLNPLPPRYISTVDSGNLAGHLLTMRAGLLGLPNLKIPASRGFEGIQDTVAVIAGLSGGTSLGLPAQPAAAADRPYVEQLSAWAAAAIQNPAVGAEAGTWVRRLSQQCDCVLGEPPSTVAAAVIVQIQKLAAQCGELANVEYAFLFEKNRQLFTIGFNVETSRMDDSYYDLLASEARLGAFVAIAQGQVSQGSWFALGRLLAGVGGEPVLVSWSGSMFEYLMPLLVMPTYQNTLLDQTCKTAVARQIEYGKSRGVPWGISESGYNAIDVHLNYQYRAFGVPGLGLKRGLAEDLVIAPYASAMALMVAPREACLNLQRLSLDGREGMYGFYESLDYTPSRLPRGEKCAVVHSFMAHHQAMSLLSLANALLDRPMQKRFEADPQFQATLLLLQERIPRATAFYSDAAEPSDMRTNAPVPEAPVRIFTTAHTSAPEIHLLSNGRYHVMVTNAGGGYSRWKDLAVTRWLEDTTRDQWGAFCYIRDVGSGEYWSSAFQPTLKAPDSYEAIFSQSRAEFRRRDQGFETYTEIAVSPEDDIELRRVTVTNRSGRRRTIDVTSYAEVVLAPPISDALHPAFSNLFVQTEILSQRQAILCTRRPRSMDEPVPWMFHLMTAPAKGEVSYETDRSEFIGRGNTPRNPQAMKMVGPLSNRDGSVLDPIVAVRYRISLAARESATVNIVTGMGETREACLGLMEKYQDLRIASRVFDLAWTHGQVALRQINATESDAQLYESLAASVLFANSSLRANPSTLELNRRGQSGLWGQSISGDLPIVLVQIADPANIELVRQLVQAHGYWRLKGLTVDLVIWNEDQAGYRQQLQEQIMGLIAAGIEASIADQPGGIFVRLAERMSNEDRILFQTVARAILTDKRGTLAEQVSHSRLVEIAPKTAVRRLIPVRREERPRPTPPPRPSDLLFFNGRGGFTADGHEYIITTTAAQMTPAPWVNVIANANFGTVVSESGLAYTWNENAHEFRLTPWSDDPVSDNSGEAFYLRDEASGHFWSPAPLPARGQGTYISRHGFGYSVFEHSEYGISSELWVYVAVDAPVKFSVLKVRNDTGKSCKLSATGYVEWVLGDLRPRSGMHIVTEVDASTRAVLARNPYSAEFGERVAFFATNEPNHTVTGDRTEFLGRNGAFSDPAAMTRARLSGRVGAGLDPCTAIQVAFELAPAQDREIVFILGSGLDTPDARSLIERFRATAAAKDALNAVWNFWNHTLGAVNVDTPDPSVNVLANGWLIYQTLSCRFWGRSGFYQSGGAFGFRDQLQDVMALVYTQPQLTRQHLLRCARHQFVEGDVQHWWHPPLNRGVRTHCSDDFLWLVMAASRYVTATGDSGVLEETVPFLEGRPLSQGEDSYYDLPNQSEEKATLYEHCVRAILRALRFGAHGLPLMLSGDWNDGMNLVGKDGKGESVWLAFFLCHVLTQFAGLARQHGDAAFADRCHTEAARLKENIERGGWDGEWYRRAYFDDGTPLGSASNAECKIDSIPQSWSVLSGAGDPGRSRLAMEAVDRHLVRRKAALIELLEPPFDRSPLNPGYIKGYVPGVRENGGQYTHAAVWATMAFAALGDTQRAWELFQMINPISHSSSPAQIAIYKVEPYVAVADVYAAQAHMGRGGWTWYTGSAGWMYRLVMESLLGLRLEGSQLRIEPCLPAQWRQFKVHYRYRETVYHISVFQDPAHGGSECITLDGVARHDLVIPLVDDSREHFAEVRLAPRAPVAELAVSGSVPSSL